MSLVLLFALASEPVLDFTPRVFAPGVISGPAHDSAPAFSPDGNTVYFGRSNSAASFILVSRKVGQTWSAPKIASFSGRWLDMEPAMAPDGRYLIFSSNRPHVEGGKPIDGDMNGKSQPQKGSHLWRIDRTPSGWGIPSPLPDMINSGGSVYAPSVAGDGTLYFMKPNAKTGHFQLFRASPSGRAYAGVEALPFSDGSDTDVDPAVARDQSFVVFGSGRHAQKDMDLFITFRSVAGWSAPIYLGDRINGPTSDAEARLSPDNKILYFSSERVSPLPTPLSPSDGNRILKEMSEWNNGLYNIWFVDLAGVIGELKSGV